jgi:hypothetical protein
MLEIVENTALPAPSEYLIEKFEIDYRVKLPDKFVKFFLNGNGAKVRPNTFDFRGNTYAIERFLCFLDRPQDNEIEGWYDIGVVITQLDERLVNDEELIGMNIIPFAFLFAGNYICLDYRSGDVPSVCIWYHETSEDLNPATETIFPSFSDFLSYF